MYRNTTVGSLPLGLSRRLLAKCSSTLRTCMIALCVTALLGSIPLHAQSGGGIQGRITDKSGAVVPKATVTATNTETGVATTVVTNGTGDYSATPLQPGNYNVEVVAKTFSRLLQENVTVDATAIQRVDLKLTSGGQDTTVTITDAPPFLNTTDATIGGTIENELYSQLPLSMNGGPRDPTAFQYLMPGVQENPNNNTGTGANNGNSGIYGGTGQTNLNENYIDGVPVNNIAQQGTNNTVSSAVSVDAVDQFSVQTNGASTSFGGAGSTNYTIKSGGNQFHGTVFDLTRNTMFDTWGFSSKVPFATGYAVKPGEHQNSYGGSLGGPVLKDKLFFFGSYEGFHYTKVSNQPQFGTVPTLAERTGNFTDLFGTLNQQLGDPTQQTTHTTFNGVPTFNVIPQSEMSPITWYMTNGCMPVGCAAKKGSLPLPTNLATNNNVLLALPLANQDYSIDVRLDYTLNSRNKFSLVSVGGTTGYDGQPDYTGGLSQLPYPYAKGIYLNQKTATAVFSYTYIINQSTINTLHYGYTRSWGQGYSLGSRVVPGQPTYSAAAAGITNLPAGNASDDMPAVSWSGGQGYTGWGSSPSTGPQATNSYTAKDDLQWIKGRHNITIGAQAQWLQANGASYGGFSNVMTFSENSADTTGGTGNSFASFLLGAIHSSSTNLQTIADVGARYRPMAPYIQDNWRATPKLTLNLGFRYDYLQPYHEVKDRITFLNPNIINPLVGIPGVLEYAGFPNASTTPAYAPYICHCTSPVHPYNKNFEPRLGFAYAVDASTVLSGGFSVQLTHAGATGGGSAGVGGGTSTTGSGTGFGGGGEFSAATSYGALGSNNPSFFLNPNIPSGVSTNAEFDPPVQGTNPNPPVGSPVGTLGPTIPCVAASTCSPYSAIPPWTIPSVTVNPLVSTGNYPFGAVNTLGCQTSDQTTCNPQGLNYSDPYYGGRGPQFVNYNFGIQRLINKKAVLSINYAGSQTHFLAGGSGRGAALNGVSPDYDQQLNELLPTAATAALLQVQAIIPSYKLPFPDFQGGAGNASALQSLKAFPQFASLTDLWGDTGNASYNSLQLSVIQRPWHNLSGFMNYTRAKEIDDTGNHRTQYPVGPQDGNFTRHYTASQIDRGLGTSAQTNAFNVAWSYTFPFGRGQAFFATNRIGGLIAGGWELSGTYKYRDGTPLQVTINGNTSQAHDNGGQNVGSGSVSLPDYVPGFNKSSARINGRYGRGPGTNASNFGQIQYINPGGYQCPDSPSFNPLFTCGSAANTNGQDTWKLGNIARSAPYDLHGPGWWDVDLGIRRTFNVRETATLHLTFQLEADLSNATNSTFFNNPATGWNTSGFGELSGTNQSVSPRDWQFGGRFRF